MVDTDTELAIPDDLWVALVAAACTIGLSLVLRFGLGQSTSVVVRLVPIFPYFVYLFVKKSVEDGPLAAVRTWAALIVVVTLAVLGYVAL
jgi:hypothetical protein